MTGNALFDFLLETIELVAAVWVAFFAIDFFAPEPMIKMIARVAVGVGALIIFLLAAKAVFFGGGSAGLHITPASIFQFAIVVIAVMVVVYIIYYVVDNFAPQFAGPIKMVVGAVAVIAILYGAEQAFTGGGGLTMRLPTSYHEGSHSLLWQ